MMRKIKSERHTVIDSHVQAENPSFVERFWRQITPERDIVEFDRAIVVTEGDPWFEPGPRRMAHVHAGEYDRVVDGARQPGLEPPQRSGRGFSVLW
jgi:hypothetical protein